MSKSEKVASADHLADEWFARNFRTAREAAGMSRSAVAELMRERGFSSFDAQKVLKVEGGGRGTGRGTTIGEALALGAIVGIDARVLAQAPELTKAKSQLSTVTLRLRELRQQEIGVMIAREATSSELARLVAEARSSENAAFLAAEIAAAEAALEGKDQ